MNTDLIISVVIGCFIYNIILKSIGMALLKVIFNNSETLQKESEKIKKTFKEKLEEKQKSENHD